MKRTLVALSSLSLLAAACGNIQARRVAELNEGGAGGNDGTTAGSGGSGGAGAATMVGGFVPEPGAGGVGLPVTPVAPEGGANTLPCDATVGAGGESEMPVGGAPPAADEACSAYCYAQVQACPDLGFADPASCIGDCVGDFDLVRPACSDGLRRSYDCIGRALRQALDDCPAALQLAGEQCGSATPDAPACHSTCLPSSLYGDATGCHATAHCGCHDVELHCVDTALGPNCTCSVGGKVAWKTATGFDYSKAACLDDNLFRLCAKELP